jgi:hypothetical protein
MKTQGKPKSGKTWKQGSKPARDLNKELNKAISKPGFAQRQAFKAHSEAGKAYEEQLKASQSKRKRDARLQAEAKKKHNAEKTAVSGQFQVLTNTRKLQHWSKKARAELMRLPTEQYYKEINTRAAAK